MSLSDAKHGVELDPQSVTTHSQFCEPDDTMSHQWSTNVATQVDACGQSPRGYSHRLTKTDEESIGRTQHAHTLYDEQWSNAQRHVSMSGDVNANVHGNDIRAFIHQ